MYTKYNQLLIRYGCTIVYICICSHNSQLYLDSSKKKNTAYLCTYMHIKSENYMRREVSDSLWCRPDTCASSYILALDVIIYVCMYIHSEIPITNAAAMQQIPQK